MFKKGEKLFKTQIIITSQYEGNKTSLAVGYEYQPYTMYTLGFMFPFMDSYRHFYFDGNIKRNRLG